MCYKSLKSPLGLKPRASNPDFRSSSLALGSFVFHSAAVNTMRSEVDSAGMMSLVLLALFLSCSDVIWKRSKAAWRAELHWLTGDIPAWTV